MNTGLKLFGGVLALVLSATSCVNDGFGREEWSVPSIACHNRFDAPTITLAEFVAKASKTGVEALTEDEIIEGYVISSDEQGVFYKTIVIQDKPENPTAGLQIEIDKGQNYVDYPVGSRIRVKTKDLVLGTDKGVVKLGVASNNTKTAIDKIPETKISNHIALVCNEGKVDVAKIVPLELTDLSQIKNQKYVNILVSISNVQFSDNEVSVGDKTYVDASNKNRPTNRVIVDNKGNNANLSTPAFAAFGGEKLPSGNGKITFVLGKYEANYQLLIRNTKDVDFTGERFTTPTKPKPIDNPTGVYLKAGDTEDFSSYEVKFAFKDSPKYINKPVVGRRDWQVAEFRNNKYIQLTANNLKNAIKVYFAVPVDFDNMTAFSFKSKDGNNVNKNVSVIKIYYSTDFTAEAKNPKLTEITSSFNISNVAPEKGYAKDFMDSGKWKKPTGLTGKGYIVFEYNGGGNLPTTTMQIDDLKVE